MAVYKLTDCDSLRPDIYIDGDFGSLLGLTVQFEGICYDLTLDTTGRCGRSDLTIDDLKAFTDCAECKKKPCYIPNGPTFDFGIIGDDVIGNLDAISMVNWSEIQPKIFCAISDAEVAECFGKAGKAEDAYNFIGDYQLLDVYLQLISIEESGNLNSENCTDTNMASVLEKYKIKCISKYFRKKYGCNIERQLSSIGIYEDGKCPLGIGNMVIEQTFIIN